MRIATSLFLATLVLPCGTLAAVPDKVADRLSTDLTPFGAERAGSDDDTIPAWTGGLTEPPPGIGYELGKHHPDPFIDDAPLFTVRAALAHRHAEQLTAGHLALLNRYPDTYKMLVYPTRRSFANPDNVYRANDRNARVGGLIESGSRVTGAINGVPFPVPNSALEIAWNHLLRFENLSSVSETDWIAVQGGLLQPTIRVHTQRHVPWNDPQITDALSLADGAYVMEIAQAVSPPMVRGDITLRRDQFGSQTRQAWRYVQGTRRVHRAPKFGQDAPFRVLEEITTNDQLHGFSGNPAHHDWRLLKKSTTLVPYNTYRLGAPNDTAEEFLGVRHPKQLLVRYELHRTWSVEAVPSPETKRPYTRRVFHIDEDSWQVLTAEHYDSRGWLWRFQERLPILLYEVGVTSTVAEVTQDFSAGNYLVTNLANAVLPPDHAGPALDPNRFTPSAIRRLCDRCSGPSPMEPAEWLKKRQALGIRTSASSSGDEPLKASPE